MWHGPHPVDYGLTQLVTKTPFGNVPKITEPQCTPYHEFMKVRLFSNRSSDLGSQTCNVVHVRRRRAVENISTSHKSAE
jgi:hypothetical protein